MKRRTQNKILVPVDGSGVEYGQIYCQNGRMKFFSSRSLFNT